MRRTRVAFYVAYLIVPQVSDPSTGNLAVFFLFSGRPHVTSFCRSTVLMVRIGGRLPETPQKFYAASARPSSPFLRAT
jgi:hypothetical protein